MVCMRERLNLYLDLIRWNRPAGWLLLLWPSLSALWDVADREFDRHVKRTAERPVTRGAVSVPEALWVGAVLALAAFGLVLTTNPATIVWSFAGLIVTLIYPYAKRHVSMPQAVLGVAFSFGIPLAFVAVGGAHLAWQDLTVQALIDDLRIGMKTSAITLGRHDVSAIMAFYALYLCGWYGLLEQEQLAWHWSLALCLAGLQAVWHFLLILDRSREGCFRAFRLNHWLGATVFAGVVLGYALR
jgi:4-hydroxybenzoate polyprenyltransferase